MCLGNCLDERQSETVAGRVFSFYESFENPATDLRRKSRSIVFDDQFCRSLMRMQPDLHLASRRQMSQFVFEQIAYHTIQ